MATEWKSDAGLFALCCRELYTPVVGDVLDDIGWAAVYLASPAAKFVTGVVLPVDGGAAIGF
jgi:enoyl-[acyl-carrier-protein] reductase (NADH)